MAAKFDVVYAFEPHPDTFEALKENVKHLPNVRCIHAFLGDKGGTAGVEGIGFGCYLKRSGNIPVVTIDSLNVKPGFIKLDVEGYEAHALMGAKETLKHRPVVMFEDKHWKRYGAKHPVTYLRGYVEVGRVHKDRIFTHDGR